MRVLSGPKYMHKAQNARGPFSLHDPFDVH